MEAVEHAVKQLNLTPKDKLADLGCGDGRALIAATQSTGCSAIGVELDPHRATLARKNVQAAGLSDKIDIVTGDALTFDLKAAGVTHVYVYLFHGLLQKLSGKLEDYPVVSVFHDIPDLHGRQRGSVWVYNV